MTFTITWHPSGRGKARSPSDPNFSGGTNFDVSKGATRTCTIGLPYPAPECGQHLAICDKCGFSIAITAAGRLDDPRTVKVACKGH